MSFKKWAMAVAFGASVAAAGLARAADEPGPNRGGLSFSGGFDVVSEYFFRGYLQEDRGFIFQPYAQMNINLIEGDVSVSPFVGIWNSFHSEQTGSDEGSGPDAWYEADIYGGIDIGFGDFTLTPIFTIYLSPNGAFETIYEAGLQLSYNDSNTLGKALGFSLNPYAAIYYEVEDDNPGGSRDAYWELGIEPAFEFNLGNTAIGLSVPLTLGMNVDDYYFDSDGDEDFFGFGSVGVAVSVPLPIPERYGTWTFTGGVSYVYLFAESARVTNDDDNDAWIWKGGISFSY